MRITCALHTCNGRVTSGICTTTSRSWIYPTYLWDILMCATYPTYDKIYLTYETTLVYVWYISKICLTYDISKPTYYYDTIIRYYTSVIMCYSVLSLANRRGCIEGCIGCINIQYIPIHAGCIGMYPNIWRMYWDVLKDVLDVNTSNTSSNTLDVLKTGAMSWSVLKDVFGCIVFMAGCIEWCTDMYWITPGCIKWCTGGCTDMYWKNAGCTVCCIEAVMKDVLDVLRFSRMYWAVYGGMYWDVMRYKPGCIEWCIVRCIRCIELC